MSGPGNVLKMRPHPLVRYHDAHCDQTVVVEPPLQHVIVPVRRGVRGRHACERSRAHGLQGLQEVWDLRLFGEDHGGVSRAHIRTSTNRVASVGQFTRRTLHHEEIWETGYGAAEVCRGPVMRIIVLFQGAPCAMHVQLVIVLSTEVLISMSLVLRRKRTCCYEAVPYIITSMANFSPSQERYLLCSASLRNRKFS